MASAISTAVPRLAGERLVAKIGALGPPIPIMSLCAEIARQSNGSSATRAFVDETAEATSESPTIERK